VKRKITTKIRNLDKKTAAARTDIDVEQYAPEKTRKKGGLNQDMTTFFHRIFFLYRLGFNVHRSGPLTSCV
jgi:hypothetical protein